MTSPSRDMLILSYASEIAARAPELARRATSEEDVRHEFNTLLDRFISAAGLGVRGQHEYYLSGGRIDSWYSGVFIEYKSPHGQGRMGEDLNVPGNRAVIAQLESRFDSVEASGAGSAARLFGIGTDAKFVVIVRRRGQHVQVDGPTPLTAYSVERLLRALVSLDAQGKPFTSENLARDFGADSPVAQEGVRQLYRAIRSTSSARALTLFQQWTILFGEVAGFDVRTANDRIEKLGLHYGLGSTPDPPALLFALHTYYAVLMKLLAAEIVSSLSTFGTSPIKRCLAAPNPEALKNELRELEAGGVWIHHGVTNFLEGDLFAWYPAAWDPDVAGAVHGLLSQLDAYDSGTLTIDPGESRDLLKQLYQHLFPPSVRHDLGEYYTPDWLAESVLDQAGYDGNPDKTLLDPACGSGTFLVLALRRARTWFEKHRFECGYGEDELARRLLKNVRGFDLNPLAVMASRTNYLLAIRDLLKYVSEVEIPVYLCDSVMTPMEATRGLGTFKYRELRTAVGRLRIPVDVIGSPSILVKYVEVLEQAVAGRYDTETFLERCRSSALPISEVSLHRRLYAQILELETNDRNGIWARIIKNAFAPAFTDNLDFVVGNPPWIFWNNLPGDYREDVRDIMTGRYGLMAHAASTMTRLGSAGKDISALFTYVCLDRYLRDGGVLAFVVTQTLFQSTAADEFRRFELPRGIPFAVESVHDWVRVAPFSAATNKTATFVARKGTQTTYPVPYTVFTPQARFDRDTSDLTTVMASVSRRSAWGQPSDPSRPSSLWLISDTPVLRTTPTAPSRYRARRGVETGLESAFRLTILGVRQPASVIVENLRDRARKPLPARKGVVEVDLVYPYVTGASISRWYADSPGAYLVPHTAATGMAPIPETEMQIKYPGAYAFLAAFRRELERRNIHLRWGKGRPFYTLYGIGPYSFAPWKVVWKRTTRDFESAVVSVLPIAGVGDRLVVPNGKVMLVAFEDPEPAHFLCAMLNSTIARSTINSAISSEAHAELLSLLDIPAFESSDVQHARLATLSTQCHVATIGGDREAVEGYEREIDRLAAFVLASSAAGVA